MYLILDDYEKDRLERISKITGIDYEVKGEFVPVSKVLSALFDLYCEYVNKEEELKDKEEHCNEFHVERKIDPYEEYGVSRKDFI